MTLASPPATIWASRCLHPGSSRGSRGWGRDRKSYVRPAAFCCRTQVESHNFSSVSLPWSAVCDRVCVKFQPRMIVGRGCHCSCDLVHPRLLPTWQSWRVLSLILIGIRPIDVPAFILAIDRPGGGDGLTRWLVPGPGRDSLMIGKRVLFSAPEIPRAAKWLKDCYGPSPATALRSPARTMPRCSSSSYCRDEGTGHRYLNTIKSVDEFLTMFRLCGYRLRP